MSYALMDHIKIKVTMNVQLAWNSVKRAITILNACLVLNLLSLIIILKNYVINALLLVQRLSL